MGEENSKNIISRCRSPDKLRSMKQAKFWNLSAKDQRSPDGDIKLFEWMSSYRNGLLSPPSPAKQQIDSAGSNASQSLRKVVAEEVVLNPVKRQHIFTR